MKWLTRIAAAITAAAVIAGTVLTSHFVIYSPFEPEAICTGEKNFAAAQYYAMGVWQISVLGQDGTRQKQYAVDTYSNVSNAVELSYDKGVYYFWDFANADKKINSYMMNEEEKDKQILKVYQLAGDTKEAPHETKLLLSSDERVCGMHVYHGTMSAVAVKTVGYRTQFTVYTAAVGSTKFNEAYSLLMPLLYVRDAVYCPDGMLCVLSSAGRAYLYSAERQTRCLDDRTGYCKSSIDLNGRLCLAHETGEICCWKQEEWSSETAMTDFTKKLQENIPSLNQCCDMDILSDKFASAVFQTNDGDKYALFYRNGIPLYKDRIPDYSWWQAVLLFCGILVLYLAAAVVLWLAVLNCFSENATLKYRLAFVSLTAAAIALASVQFGLIKQYRWQEKVQCWEQMAMLLEYAGVYLEADSSEELAMLAAVDPDELPKLTKQCSLTEELREFVSRNHTQWNQYVLMMNDDNMNLRTVAGADETMGRTVDQLFDQQTAEQLTDLWHGKCDCVTGSYKRCGADWKYIAKRFDDTESGSSGILLLQTVSENINEKDVLLIIAIAVLYLMTILFITLLHRRLCKALRPLSKIEQEAKCIMQHGTFDEEIIRGSNEIALLTRRFQNAVYELTTSMEKSRQSFASYSRFLNHGWIELLGRENLFQIHAGNRAECQAAVLEMRMIPHIGVTEEKLYEKLLTVIRSSGGIPERLDPERMRFLFPQGSTSAICAASSIRELTAHEYEMVAVVDFGTVEICVLGDEQDSRMHSCLAGEAETFPLMRRVCGEYGCDIIATDAAVQSIENFRNIFNSRFVGFFQLSGNDSVPVRLVEILPQKHGDTFEKAVGQYLSGEYANAFTGFCQVLEHHPEDHAAVYYLQLCSRALNGEGE
ncbi:MAG: hypothetical protein K5979_01035 [Ruminococcus sp.]|nr:hypothetical protein [Ruminococcus sp.]